VTNSSEEASFRSGKFVLNIQFKTKKFKPFLKKSRLPSRNMSRLREKTAAEREIFLDDNIDFTYCTQPTISFSVPSAALVLAAAIPTSKPASQWPC